MSITNWKFPGTTENIDYDSGYDWSDTNYATSDDTSYASVTVDTKAWSDYLCCKNYGFSSSDVPSGATINGIEAIICKYSSASSKVGDKRVYLTKNGSAVIGNNYASVSNWPTSSPSEVTYGGATSLWNTTWTQSEIVANTFGLMIVVNKVGITAYVDYIKLRVYYTAAAAAGGIRNPFRKPFFGALGGPF